MRNRRNKRNTVKPNNSIKIISILCVIIGLIFVSVIFSLLNSTNDKIVAGVRIEGINVSGLSQSEAREKLKQWYQDVVLKNIQLKYDDFEEDIDLTEFDIEENIEKVIPEALKVGRDGNIITNNYSILFALLFHKNFDVDIKINDEKLDNRITEVSSKLPDAVVQSSYYIEDEELIIKKGTSGTIAKTDELKQKIKDIIKKDVDKIVEIPVTNVDPDEINIDKIHEEIYKEAQDARIEENPVKVYPQVDGIDFAISIEEAKAMLEEDKDEYVIPLTIVNPEITLDILGQNAFPEKISEFITRYDITNENRSNNIILASEKIDGTIVKPGETFSYNRIVGERTISKGYKEAAVYSGGKVVQGIGGGICQVSSTLYNAALYANLEIVQRSNHRFLTSYVSAGRDATVSWGTIDLKFKNTRKYPIKVVCIAGNGIIKIQIFGIKEEEEYEVSLETEILDETDYKTTYIEDDTIYEGREFIRQVGSKAVKSQTYKVLKQRGKEISRQLLSTDTYSSLEQVIAKGTKKIDENTSEEEINAQTQTNEVTNTFTYPVVQQGGSIWGSTTGID